MSKQIDALNATIDRLYVTSNVSMRNKLLNTLRKETKVLSDMLQRMERGEEETERIEKLFTVEELSRYNGKNGYPAYVAVNEAVYDVSDIAAWGGATHFGLVAGEDVTEAFITCHGDQSFLDFVPVVGVMAK
jgi:predicted heme/steroid binding protein